MIHDPHQNNRQIIDFPLVAPFSPTSHLDREEFDIERFRHTDCRLHTAAIAEIICTDLVTTIKRTKPFEEIETKLTQLNM